MEATAQAARGPSVLSFIPYRRPAALPPKRWTKPQDSGFGAVVSVSVAEPPEPCRIGSAGGEAQGRSIGQKDLGGISGGAAALTKGSAETARYALDGSRSSVSPGGSEVPGAAGRGWVHLGLAGP